MRFKRIAALAAAAVVTAQMTAVGASAATYWLSIKGHYFSTQAAAIADGGSAVSVDSSTMTAAEIASVDKYGRGTSRYYYKDYGWWSSLTKKFYDTEAEAIAASGGNSSYVTYRSYADVYGYDYYYYGFNPYYYNYNYYPYYYYRKYSYYPYYYNYYYPYYYSTGYGYYNYYGYDMNYYNYMSFKNRDNADTVQNREKSVSFGTPYISGRPSFAGWDDIYKFMRDVKNGESVKVVLNGATSVPDSILSYIKGRDIALKLILSNGSSWTINGLNIKSARPVNPTIEYNINFIPTKLKNKAKKDSIATYQLGIANGFDSLGTTATVNVKVNAARAGRTALIYRYDMETESLQTVQTTIVEADGGCTFNVTDGGAYYIVLK